MTSYEISEVNVSQQNIKDIVRDKAICSGKLDSFNLNTGEAEVTFSINRRKY